MYINTWYVAARQSELSERPHAVRMLGRDFVLFRNAAGHVVCLSSVCPHRGANLALGCCHSDGTLACPFHGWRFNADGACTAIPSNAVPTDIPARARVDSYPVIERHGLIWVMLGDDPDSALPLYEMPEFDDASYRSVLYDDIWKANVHWTKMVNLDHVHLPIVHGTSFGGDNPVRPPDHQVEQLVNGFHTQIHVQPARPKGAWQNVREAGRGVVSKLSYFVPGFTLRGDIEIGGAGSGTRIVFYETSTPVDDETTHMRWIFFRNFMTGPENDAEHLKRNLKNVGEDKIMAEAMQPRRPTGHPHPRQMLVDREDRLMQAYWQAMQQQRERGFEIDRKRLRKCDEAGDYRVIASPARRRSTGDGFVYDTVPTHPAIVAAQHLPQEGGAPAKRAPGG
ncbi:MAG: aromatic ring-hydroxylating dioxygenase subunit alpha [Gammaproteobacteria bacterium]